MLKDNLVVLRNFKGYSQEKIAEEIGIALIPAEMFEARIRGVMKEIKE